MKLKNKIVLLALVLFVSLTQAAYADDSDDWDDWIDDVDDNVAPAAPINQWNIPLLITGVVLVFVYLKKQTKTQNK